MLLKNSLIFGGLSVIKGLLIFATIALYTRLLSPAEYGDFIVVMTLMVFFDASFFMWMRHGIMRNITHVPAAGDNSDIANTAVIYIAAAVLSTLAAVGIAWSGYVDGNALVYELLAFMIVGEAFYNLFVTLARLRNHRLVFFMMDVMRPIMALLLGVFLIRSGFGAAGAVFGMLAAYVMAFGVAYVGLREFRPVKFSLVTRAALMDILRFGVPLIAVYSVQSAIAASSRVMLEGMIGGDATGLYSAAAEIPYRLLNTIMMAIHMAAFPLAVQKLDHVGIDECRDQLKKNFILLLGVSLPAFAGIAALSTPFAYIFVGPDFRPFAEQYFGVFAFSAFLSGMIQYYFAVSFHFAKKTNILIIPTAVTLIANVIFVYAGISWFGLPGAVYSSLSMTCFFLAAVIFFARGVFPMPVPWRETIQIILATAIMAACVRFLDVGESVTGFACAICLGGAVYAALITAMNTGGARTEGLKIADKIIKRLVKQH